MSLPKIIIGAPIRDREWILPEYFNALLELDYPKELISFCFILNDCEDNSSTLVTQFMDLALKMGYRRVNVSTYNLNAVKDTRSSDIRAQIYHSLAKIRNYLLSQIEDEDYLFSVDSDIIIPPDSLKKLVASNKDICSALIYNDLHFASPELRWPHRYCNILIEKNEGIKHYMNYPQKSLFQVHTTGAVYLLSKEVCQNVKYEFHKQGEDIGFCINAHKLGYGVWCNSDIFCDHRMRRD